ncbi:hypothetical protein BC826DRAFT_453183 [Russula brevipes]|nr:hypothetical protein BC826DRAFT_453183 [Russula brevipes]
MLTSPKPQTSRPDPPPANSSTLQDLGTRKNKVTRKAKVVRKPRKSNALDTQKATPPTPALQDLSTSTTSAFVSAPLLSPQSPTPSPPLPPPLPRPLHPQHTTPQPRRP